MSNGSALIEPTSAVIIGVDTHKHVRVAVAINRVGARLATLSAPADNAGYTELLALASQAPPPTAPRTDQRVTTQRHHTQTLTHRRGGKKHHKKHKHQAAATQKR